MKLSLSHTEAKGKKELKPFQLPPLAEIDIQQNFHRLKSKGTQTSGQA